MLNGFRKSWLAGCAAVCFLVSTALAYFPGYFTSVVATTLTVSGLTSLQRVNVSDIFTVGSTTFTVSGATVSVPSGRFFVDGGTKTFAIIGGHVFIGGRLDVNGGATIRGQETITSTLTVRGNTIGTASDMTLQSNGGNTRLRLSTGGNLFTGGFDIAAADAVRFMTPLGSAQLKTDGEELIMADSTVGGYFLSYDRTVQRLWLQNGLAINRADRNKAASGKILHASSGAFVLDGTGASISADVSTAAIAGVLVAGRESEAVAASSGCLRAVPAMSVDGAAVSSGSIVALRIRGGGYGSTLVFTTTTTATVPGPLGVLTQSACPTNTVCTVCVQGLVNVNCATGLSVSNAAVTSGTRGVAGHSASPLSANTVGLYMETQSSGADGSCVLALGFGY